MSGPQTTGEVLAAISTGALGATAPETLALRWITEQSKARTLRRGVSELGISVEEGPGFAHRLYEAVRDHFAGRQA